MLSRRFLLSFGGSVLRAPNFAKSSARFSESKFFADLVSASRLVLFLLVVWRPSPTSRSPLLMFRMGGLPHFQGLKQHSYAFCITFLILFLAGAFRAKSPSTRSVIIAPPNRISPSRPLLLNATASTGLSKTNSMMPSSFEDQTAVWGLWRARICADTRSGQTSKGTAALNVLL